MLKTKTPTLFKHTYFKYIIFIFSISYCNKPIIYTPQIAKKQEVKLILKNLKQNLSKVEGVKKEEIPITVPDQLKDQDIKTVISKLSSYLKDKKLLKDDSKVAENNSYTLLFSLYKILKDLKNPKIITKSEIKSFKQAIDSSSEYIIKQNKTREIFDKICEKITQKSPKVTEDIKSELKKDSDHLVCKICDKDEKNNLLHKILLILPKKVNNNTYSELDKIMYDRLNIIILEMDKYSPDSLKQANKDGYTPLHIACEKNLAKKLLDKISSKTTIPLDSKDQKGNTPLHYASKNNAKESVYLLISQKNSLVDILNNRKETPLHLSGMNDENTSEILKHSTKINSKDIDGNTPLHRYIINLKNKWVPDYKRDGNSATLEEFHPAYVSIKNIMLKKPNKNIKNNEGYTPYKLLEQIKSDITKNNNEALYKNAINHLK